MSANNRWSDVSQKDLTFAVLMSSGDGSCNVKANWPKVEEIMKSWGYGFTQGAMSQQWSKKILKEFKDRHPDNAKNEGGASNPNTPSKASGNRGPKTPTSTKGRGKGKKRSVDDEDDDDTFPDGISNPKFLAKEETHRASASKKLKHSEEPSGSEDNDAFCGIKIEVTDGEDYGLIV